ncbi:PH domain-containing protein [Flavobacterium sp. XGLA_31]|uniref:PH domain-containing protein n=1 Tax=Flavobacterium sp. XGLA_31 TaxID=3447666 RepID=UPI003F3D02B4
MKTDFTSPQRQAPIGILVMFLSTLKGIVKAFWILFIVVILKSDNMNAFYFVVGFLMLIGITGLISYLKYINFTFYIDEEKDEFIINSGVINKTKTVIQLNKIQQVNINQDFVQQLIKVFSLDIETAGSESKEVEIKAVSHELALALKEKLIHGKVTAKADHEEQESSETVDGNEPFIKISFWSLFKIGITSNYVRSLGLIVAFFFTVYENISHIFGDDELENGRVGTYIKNGVTFNAVMIFIGFLMFGILLFNLGRTIIRYFGFKITKQKGTLVLNFGLINIKNSIVRPERVQIISVSRNYFQKKLNIFQVIIRQAMNGEKDQRKTALEIPGCDETEKNQILKLLFNELPTKGLMITPNFRKLVFSLFLLVFLPILGYCLVGRYSDSSVFDFYGIAVFYSVLVMALLYFGFRNYRLFLNEKYIIKQSGAWDIENQIIEIHKIQAITTSQLFWHKNLNIGSLTLHTAAGDLSFYLGNYATINDYVNLWLYLIETSDSNWM